VASVRERLPANAPGDFYVDSTCIDCGTCRWVAPKSFDAHGDASRVYHQPGNAGETHRAFPLRSLSPLAAADGKPAPPHGSSVERLGLRSQPTRFRSYGFPFCSRPAAGSRPTNAREPAVRVNIDRTPSNRNASAISSMTAAIGRVTKMA